jgi:hypothetical protein
LARWSANDESVDVSDVQAQGVNWAPFFVGGVGESFCFIRRGIWTTLKNNTSTPIR